MNKYKNTHTTEVLFHPQHRSKGSIYDLLFFRAICPINKQSSSITVSELIISSLYKFPISPQIPHPTLMIKAQNYSFTRKESITRQLLKNVYGSIDFQQKRKLYFVHYFNLFLYIRRCSRF